MNQAWRRIFREGFDPKSSFFAKPAKYNLFTTKRLTIDPRIHNHEVPGSSPGLFTCKVPPARTRELFAQQKSSNTGLATATHKENSHFYRVAILVGVGF